MGILAWPHLGTVGKPLPSKLRSICLAFIITCFLIRFQRMFPIASSHVSRHNNLIKMSSFGRTRHRTCIYHRMCFKRWRLCFGAARIFLCRRTKRIQTCKSLTLKNRKRTLPEEHIEVLETYKVIIVIFFESRIQLDSLSGWSNYNWLTKDVSS